MRAEGTDSTDSPELNPPRGALGTERIGERQAEPDVAPRMRRYLVAATVVIAAIVAVSAGWSLRKSSTHFRRIAREMGVAFFEELVITRQWNAKHGGVYVWQTDELAPNEYLNDPDRDLTLPDGRRLTLVNPAFMTRLISELAQHRQGVQFRMTSLEPINPKNAADAWETAALRSFETGAEEMFAIMPVNGEERARYIGRLIVEEDCMNCHAHQGYEVGMVRGGISVSFPFATFREGLTSAHRNTLWLHGVFLTLGLTLLWGLGLRLQRSVVSLARANADMRELNEELENTVVTDPLTGIGNRLFVDRALEAEVRRTARYGIELSVAMLDMDLFKGINDEHGHQTGDLVLREIAQLLAKNTRATDHLARWGGEEFLLVAPHADLSQVRQVAEKFRTLVEQSAFARGCRMTISVGVAQLEPGEDADSLLRRADAAMYRAKKAGRNRVEG